MFMALDICLSFSYSAFHFFSKWSQDSNNGDAYYLGITSC